MNKEFKKGDKVWVSGFLGWDEGKVCENVLDDGTYLVRVGKNVRRVSYGNLEKRTGRWKWIKKHL